ncbi:MAG: hypothetical protein ABEI52_08950 [Halobacteriaceae archaeon]
MDVIPLPILDDFLSDYTVGQALFAVFVLGTFGVLTQKSRKLLSLHFGLFGLIFLLTPASLEPIHYKFLGIALLVVGPVLYSTAK